MEYKPYIHNAKYYETDQMAIVHHSNYIRWFEEARIDWMNQIGIDFRDVEAMGIVVPVVSVSCQYKRVTRFGDDVAITPRLTLYNGIRFAFSYEVRDAHTGELRATGESQHCFLRGEQVANLKRAAPELHARFAEAAGIF
jgi:acyl-CoA thioester hydrolase